MTNSIQEDTNPKAEDEYKKYGFITTVIDMIGIPVDPDIERVAHGVAGRYIATILYNSVSLGIALKSIAEAGVAKHSNAASKEEYKDQRDKITVLNLAFRQAPSKESTNANNLCLLTSMDAMLTSGVTIKDLIGFIKAFGKYCEYGNGANVDITGIVEKMYTKVDSWIKGENKAKRTIPKETLLLQKKLLFLIKGLKNESRVDVYEKIKEFDIEPPEEADETKEERLIKLDNDLGGLMISFGYDPEDVTITPDKASTAVEASEAAAGDAAVVEAAEAAAAAAVEAPTDEDTAIVEAAEDAVEADTAEAASDEAAVVEAAAAEAAVEAPTTLQVNIANMYEVERSKLVNAQHLRHQSLASAMPIESDPSPERVQNEKLAAFVEFMKSDNLGNDMAQKLSDAGFYDVNVSDSVLKCIVGQCHNDYGGKKQKRKRHTLREKVKDALGPDSTYRNKHQLAGVWMDKLGLKKFSWSSETRDAITEMAEEINRPNRDRPKPGGG